MSNQKKRKRNGFGRKVDFARACIEPTKVFSIENILETYARQNIIDSLMREIYGEARNKDHQINFDIGVGETADWVLAELSDYGYGVTSKEICINGVGPFKRVMVQW